AHRHALPRGPLLRGEVRTWLHRHVLYGLLGVRVVVIGHQRASIIHPRRAHDRDLLVHERQHQAPLGSRYWSSTARSRSSSDRPPDTPGAVVAHDTDNAPACSRVAPSGEAIA